METKPLDMRKKEKTFDRKEELLKAAEEEFTTRSYAEASLNNIIKRAGISKGTFYYHFQDKQDLYLTLLKNLVNIKLEFMEKKLKEEVHNEDLNLFDNLKLQARYGIELAKENPNYYLLGLMFLKEAGNPIYETAMTMLDGTSKNYMGGMLEKAMERGELREGISLSFAQKIMSYLLYRSDEIFSLRQGEMDFDVMLREFGELIDFIQYGLGKR
jgi:AcrR family transcriptional regulator